MVTLIKHKSGDNKTRICGARCYNAKGAVCVCICGGKNHGVGLTKAADNSLEIARCLMTETSVQLGLTTKVLEGGDYAW